MNLQDLLLIVIPLLVITLYDIRHLAPERFFFHLFVFHSLFLYCSG